MRAQGPDIEGIFRRHVKTVWRLCYSYLGSSADAEDATQATFMRLVDHPRTFESEEHEKAWLLVVAANICKDVLKSAARTRVVAMPEDGPEPAADTEGWKTDDIARHLGAPPSTVRNRLRDARALLKEALGGERA